MKTKRKIKRSLARHKEGLPLKEPMGPKHSTIASSVNKEVSYKSALTVRKETSAVSNAFTYKTDE